MFTAGGENNSCICQPMNGRTKCGPAAQWNTIRARKLVN